MYEVINMSEGERSGWDRGQLKQGRLHTLNGCFHGYQVNILTLFGSSQHLDISFKIISDTLKLNSYKI